ncbi:MAG: carbohydrate-binding domain-containing protein [Lachnospiraceae bacterium]|nr:carbohydrate-binding domain-containing protein [Lachnospiraceae bacterium]
MRKNISILLCITLILTMFAGCAGNNANADTFGNEKSAATEVDSTGTVAETADFFQSEEDMFTDRDYESSYKESESIRIQLNGTSASASADSVKISGTTITITEEATYVFSGTLNDGRIVVEADDTAKLQIVLNGVNINSENSAALLILSADKVFVTLADGTENVLSNGGVFEAIDENNIDGAVYSRQDLTFNGNGTLTVTSPVGHGIVCKDDLVFTGGTYIVSAASHGLDANDSVRIAEASMTIDAGKDGIHAENTEDASLGFVYILSETINIEAEGDGISAGAFLQVEDGTIDLLVGGGYENGTSQSSASYGGFKGGGKPGRSYAQTVPEENSPNMMASEESSSMTTSEESSTSMKGLKAASGVLISNGRITIDSADDSIHSNASVIINGGTFEIASGDDAVHADDTLTITDCNMNISKSYEGLEAQKLYVKGGTIVLNSTDDGLNASGGTDSSGTTGGRDGMFGGEKQSSGNGVMEISGGNLTIYASGDGLDSNGTLTISHGYIYVANPTAGDTSIIDADVSPVITGGTFVSTGSTTMMAQTFASSSTQGVISCTTGTQSPGSVVTVKDSNGNSVISYEVEYSCVMVIISSPDILKGDTYTLTIGTTSGSVQAE